MTIIEIETFIEIVHQKTISGAAKSLYISQPTISRRIQHMEEELGYPLFIRQKGKREIILTDEGSAFLRIAGKWQQLLQETNAISEIARRDLLSIGSMYSVSRGLLSHILPDLLEEGYRFRLYNAFSESAYDYMDRGIYELAFIAQQNYFSPIPPGIQQLPAFTETYMVACASEQSSGSSEIDIHQLQPEHELHVPWDISYMQWRVASGSSMFAPQVVLEDMTMLPAFLKESSWIILPYTLAQELHRQGVYIYRIQNPPPKRLTYYLSREGDKEEVVSAVLSALDREIRTMPGEAIESMLNPDG